MVPLVMTVFPSGSAHRFWKGKSLMQPPMKLSPQHFCKTFKDEFSCKIELSDFHCRLFKPRAVYPSHPGTEQF